MVGAMSMGEVGAMDTPPAVKPGTVDHQERHLLVARQPAVLAATLVRGLAGQRA